MRINYYFYVAAIMNCMSMVIIYSVQTRYTSRYHLSPHETLLGPIGLVLTLFDNVIASGYAIGLGLGLFVYSSLFFKAVSSEAEAKELYISMGFVASISVLAIFTVLVGNKKKDDGRPKDIYGPIILG